MSEKIQDYLGLKPNLILILYNSDDTIFMSESPSQVPNALDELLTFAQNGSSR